MILSGGGIEFCKPSVQYGRGMSCGFQLPQRNPDAGAAVAILRGRQSRRRRAGSDRVHDPALDSDILRKPKALDHSLKRLMACDIERSGPAFIAGRMPGIKMCAGN